MPKTKYRLPADKDIIEIHKDIEGELHADHGPALIYKLPHMKDIVVTEWFKHGVYHNEWGPAETMVQGYTPISAYYYIDGIEVANSHYEWEQFITLRGLSKEDRVTLKMMA